MEQIFNPTSGKFFAVDKIVSKETDLPKKKVFKRVIERPEYRYLIYESFNGVIYALHKDLRKRVVQKKMLFV